MILFPYHQVRHQPAKTAGRFIQFHNIPFFTVCQIFQLFLNHTALARIPADDFSYPASQRAGAKKTGYFLFIHPVVLQVIISQDQIHVRSVTGKYILQDLLLFHGMYFTADLLRMNLRLIE